MKKEEEIPLRSIESKYVLGDSNRKMRMPAAECLKCEVEMDFHMLLSLKAICLINLRGSSRWSSARGMGGWGEGRGGLWAELSADLHYVNCRRNLNNHLQFKCRAQHFRQARKPLDN